MSFFRSHYCRLKLRADGDRGPLIWGPTVWGPTPPSYGLWELGDNLSGACDIFGPTQQPSIQGGYRYWITFVDDYTRRLWIYLLIERKNAVVAFKQFVNDFAAASRGVQALYYSVDNYVPFIEHIRTDNAGEFVGAKSKFATFLRETGVAHEFSAPHVHQSSKNF